MTAAIPVNLATPERGVVYYDAECAFCARNVARWGAVFTRRGFRWVPLQTPGAAERLGPAGDSLREEMKLSLPGGRVAGGIDAWAVLTRSVWWLWPVGVLLALPGIHWLGARGYRWVAEHRHCLGGVCTLPGAGARRHRPIPFLELP